MEAMTAPACDSCGYSFELVRDGQCNSCRNAGDNGVTVMGKPRREGKR